MKYAMVRNNRVLKIEDCIRNGEFCPLESLYPNEICKLFTVIPTELEGKVRAGWTYVEEKFCEPAIGEYITELNSRYFPDNIGVIYGLLIQKEKDLWQAFTDRHIEIIEAQQSITDLELQDIERVKSE